MPAHPLDPRARAAIEHLRVNRSYWVGPIMPHNLPAVLPPHGTRHSWRDAVTTFLLCELMGVHRVAAGKEPFWHGIMYQVNRNDLAKKFDCEPDDISNSLQWLKALGLAVVVHHTRIDGVGKPCGTEVFVVPRMDRIKLILDFFTENDHALTASQLMESDPLQAGSKSLLTKGKHLLNGGQTQHEPSPYLNCVQPQQKFDEGGGEASAQQTAQPVTADRGRRVDDGGGEAAEKEKQVPKPKQPGRAPAAHLAEHLPVSASPSAIGTVHNSAPPTWQVPIPPASLAVESQRQKMAWRKGCLFCAMWQIAIVRLNWLSLCTVNSGDCKKAFEFFKQEPQIGPFFVLAAAINAWSLSEKPMPKGQSWDKLYHVRNSTELQTFIRSFASGKLESEVGQQRLKINAWTDLRLCFTESELIFFGWSSSHLPVVALSEDEIWENDPDAPDYYRQRHLPLPAEVLEAEKLRQLEQGEPESISSKIKEEIKP